MVDYLTYILNVGHRGVLVMFGKQHGVVVYLVVLFSVTLAWVGLASAQQQATTAPAARRSLARCARTAMHRIASVNPNAAPAQMRGPVLNGM